eukprot:2744745-Prorocentrum_lima.AAC.1
MDGRALCCRQELWDAMQHRLSLFVELPEALPVHLAALVGGDCDASNLKDWAPQAAVTCIGFLTSEA